MNKVLIAGRLARNPEMQVTNSGVSYVRFTVAVKRTFGDETDFIPVIAWRSQAEFVGKYLDKGALISLEGAFNSSSYTNNDNQMVTRYEVRAERIQSLETKAQAEARRSNSTKTFEKNISVEDTQVMKFEEENKPEAETKEDDVPWELDL